jgi:hypothetical protein
LSLFPPAGLTSLPVDAVRGLLRRQVRARAAGSGPAPDAGVPQPATSMATLRKPDSNDGVWIRYGQQKWISAGRPIPFVDSEFVRVGQYGEFPVFRRTRASEELIYLPTREGLIVPYRLKP